MSSHSQKRNPDSSRDKKPQPGKPKSKVQAKLSINVPGDGYEQEAEANAERIGRIASAGKDGQPKSLIGASVHKKKSSAGYGGVPVPPDFQDALAGAQREGQPLTGELKTFMEDAFSSDFSNVRIHTGDTAADLNDQIEARAFTNGNDIYFNKGQYKPGSVEGKKLLAHELSHVQQQLTTGPAQQIQRDKKRGQGHGTRRPTPRPSPARVTVVHIEVHFNGTIIDRGSVVPTGTATATFSDRTTASTPVSGGSTRRGYGVTDPVVNHTIFRVEGAGYHNHNNDAMPYALFYNGGEALHIGSLSRTSHGCVHVGNNTWMQKVNGATVNNHTTVTVHYDPTVWARVTQSHPPPVQRTTPPPPPRRQH
jgi:hypothetical protein